MATTSAPDAHFVDVNPREVVVGPRTVRFGPNSDENAFLKPLLNSGPLLQAGDFKALRANLERDGYLFLRGALPAEDVTSARSRVLHHFEELGGKDEGDAASATPDVKIKVDNAAPKQSRILDPTKPLEDGVLMKNCGFGCVPFMEGKNPVTHSPELLKVFEGPALRGVFQGIFDTKDVRSFDFKWLRAVPKAKFTGAHMDNVCVLGVLKRVLKLCRFSSNIGGTAVVAARMHACHDANL